MVHTDWATSQLYFLFLSNIILNLVTESSFQDLGKKLKYPEYNQKSVLIKLSPFLLFILYIYIDIISCCGKVFKVFYVSLEILLP